MTRILIYILILLLSENHNFGQYILRGSIIDEDSLPLSGVVIIDNFSKAEALSDTNGKFELNINSDTSCIYFKYLGYQDTSICGMSNITFPLQLVPNLSTLDEIHLVGIDYQWADNTSIAFYSGALHVPFGFAIGNFTSYVYNIPLMTVTQIEYRTDLKNNNNFHFRLARYNGKNHRDFHLGLSYDYHKFLINDSKSYFEYVCQEFNTTWNYKKVYLFLGYGYSTKDTKDFQGILSTIGFEIPFVNIGLII